MVINLRNCCLLILGLVMLISYAESSYDCDITKTKNYSEIQALVNVCLNKIDQLDNATIFQIAVYFFVNEDYRASEDLLIKLPQDTSKVPYILGLIYEYAHNDRKAAVNYYRNSASLGSQKAVIVLLGKTGLNKSEYEMKIRKAAKEGNIFAYESLANLLSERNMVHESMLQLDKSEVLSARSLSRLGAGYEAGIGVGKNPVKAMSLYKKSAILGYLPAAKRVGESYGKGLGIKPDNNKALLWLLYASKNGDAQANLLIENVVPSLKNGEQVLRNAKRNYYKFESKIKHQIVISNINLFSKF